MHFSDLVNVARSIVSKRTPLNNPWITTGIIASINKKHELHDEWDKARRKYCLRNENKKCNEVDEACHCWPCNSARDKEESFKVKRTLVKKIIHLAKRGYTCNKIDECQGDSKKMWRVINDDDDENLKITGYNEHFINNR